MDLRNLTYKIEVVWDGLSGGEVKTRNSNVVKLDMPPEFGGEGKYLCPDEIFISAVGGCLLTTFLYFKRKRNLNLDGINVLVKGNVDLVGAEGYRITGIEAVLQILVKKEDEAEAKKCADLALNYCHITRTLEKAIPIKTSVKINTSA
jgi:organic hydroperoxide reductase OsmC/OhrA